MKYWLFVLIFLTAGGLLMAGGTKEAFHETASNVDMNRFTGDWYVIAVIPTPFEKGAANGIENYSLDKDGNIRVEYTFYKGSPQGKKKVMYQKGWIYNKETNADWRVRPLWPLKLPYYILEVDDEYTYTVIATNNYKYLWIMAREPKIDSDLLSEIVKRQQDRGFDPEKIEYMEQNWE